MVSKIHSTNLAQADFSGKERKEGRVKERKREREEERKKEQTDIKAIAIASGSVMELNEVN
jgi:hypothetical protein